MRYCLTLYVFLVSFFINASVLAVTPVKDKPYLPARPAIGRFHLAMSADSAELVMRNTALRISRFALDSLAIIESDSVRVFGEPAYVQLQLLNSKVRTLVVNFHPLSGDRYLNTRTTLSSYMERFFGIGVITKNGSVTNRRWENEDGTMEVSYSDKYYRVFVRLGKH